MCSCKVCFPFLGYIHECDFESVYISLVVILLHEINVIYYIFVHYILLGYPKTQGWHHCLGWGTLSLIFSTCWFFGHFFSNFFQLVHLVFKSLKCLVSVDIITKEAHSECMG